MTLTTGEYSPIRHLAPILLPPWMDREKANFVMLTCAFDAGGTDTTQHLTVAGFASSQKHWDEFSEKWKARLGKDGIEFFRAVDAACFRGPFQHWYDRPDREQLRRALFVDLMNLIKSYAYQKFSCTIINKDFQQSSDELHEKFALCAYSLAGRTCEYRAREWVKSEWKSCPEMTIALVFEAGDQGHGKLQEGLRADSGRIPANFRPKKDMQRDDGMIEYGFVPLQAADWFAWEVNRATKDFYGGKLESESQLRWPMQQFLGKPFGHMGIYALDSFQRMDDVQALQKKIVSWEISIGEASGKSI